MTCPVSRRNLVYSTRIARERCGTVGLLRVARYVNEERRFPNMKTSETLTSSQLIYTPTIYNLSRIIFSPESLFVWGTPCFSPTPGRQKMVRQWLRYIIQATGEDTVPFSATPSQTFTTLEASCSQPPTPAPRGTLASLPQPSPCYCHCSVVLQP